MTDTIEPVPARIDQQLAQQLVEAARREGVELAGPGGLLTVLTKTVLETALEAEVTEHLGYEAHGAVGRDGGNSRNGTRSKTVLTETGRWRCWTTTWRSVHGLHVWFVGGVHGLATGPCRTDCRRQAQRLRRGAKVRWQEDGGRDALSSVWWQ